MAETSSSQIVAAVGPARHCGSIWTAQSAGSLGLPSRHMEPWPWRAEDLSRYVYALLLGEDNATYVIGDRIEFRMNPQITGRCAATHSASYSCANRFPFVEYGKSFVFVARPRLGIEGEEQALQYVSRITDHVCRNHCVDWSTSVAFENHDAILVLLRVLQRPQRVVRRAVNIGHHATHRTLVFRDLAGIVHIRQMPSVRQAFGVSGRREFTLASPRKRITATALHLVVRRRW